jgi:hypothetical protein
VVVSIAVFMRSKFGDSDAPFSATWKKGDSICQLKLTSLVSEFAFNLYFIMKNIKKKIPDQISDLSVTGK